MNSLLQLFSFKKKNNALNEAQSLKVFSKEKRIKKKKLERPLSITEELSGDSLNANEVQAEFFSSPKNIRKSAQENSSNKTSSPKRGGSTAYLSQTPTLYLPNQKQIPYPNSMPSSPYLSRHNSSTSLNSSSPNDVLLKIERKTSDEFQTSFEDLNEEKIESFIRSGLSESQRQEASSLVHLVQAILRKKTKLVFILLQNFSYDLNEIPSNLPKTVGTVTNYSPLGAAIFTHSFDITKTLLLGGARIESPVYKTQDLFWNLKNDQLCGSGFIDGPNAVSFAKKLLSKTKDQNLNTLIKLLKKGIPRLWIPEKNKFFDDSVQETIFTLLLCKKRHDYSGDYLSHIQKPTLFKIITFFANSSIPKSMDEHLQIQIAKNSSYIPPKRHLYKLGWFGNATRLDAEKLLQKQPLDTFLVRWSDNATSYVLSVRRTWGCEHFGRIFPHGNSIKVVKNSTNSEIYFPSLFEVVKLHHVSSPIPREYVSFHEK